MRFLPGLCLLLATCNDRARPPAVPPPTSVSLFVDAAGRRIPVLALTGYESRRRALFDHANFAKNSGLLIAHARDRYMQIYFFEPWAAVHRVDFLDASGKIVDSQTLKAGDKGIMSESEARYALITHAELLGSSLAKGDSVTLSDEVQKLKPSELPTMKINGVPVYVELATTIDERNRGLMHRPRMSENDGMLFAYPGDGHRGFWMRNTLINLSLAYIRSDGVISEFHEMEKYPDPASESYNKSYPSREFVQYVLEVNPGFFRKRQLKEGMKVELPPELSGYKPE